MSRRPSPRPRPARTARRTRPGATGPPPSRAPRRADAAPPSRGSGPGPRRHGAGPARRSSARPGRSRRSPTAGRHGGRCRWPPRCPCPDGSGRARPGPPRLRPRTAAPPCRCRGGRWRHSPAPDGGRRRRWTRTPTPPARTPGRYASPRSRGRSSPSAPGRGPRTPAVASRDGCAPRRTHPNGSGRAQRAAPPTPDHRAPDPPRTRAGTLRPARRLSANPASRRG